MRFSPRAKRIVLASVSGSVLLLAVLSALCSLQPVGYFGSYKMLPHESGDVLQFRSGRVTWKTCCGTTPQGTYERLKDGTWAWHFVWGRKRPETNEVILQPGLFAITCIERSNPTNRFRLPRRLFAPKEI